MYLFAGFFPTQTHIAGIVNALGGKRVKQNEYYEIDMI